MRTFGLFLVSLCALGQAGSALDAAQDRAIKLMRLGTVRILTPAGTDFFFRIGQRPFHKQSGGAIVVAPIEDSGTGNIVLPEERFGDTVARRVVLQIDNGRITRVRAEQGLPQVEAALAAGGETARRFGLFLLGFGEGEGLVRIGFGRNQDSGGDVGGDYVRWFTFDHASVHVDFRYLMRDGKLTDEFR